MKSNAIRSLVLKDILIQKRMIAVMGLYSIFFFALFGVLDETPSARFIYIIDGIVVAVVMALGSFKGEKKNPDAFTGSLPVSRRDIVIGKFVILFLGAVYGLVTAGAIGLVLRLSLPRFCTEYLSLPAILGVFIGAAAFSLVIPLSLLLGQTGVKAILVGLLSATIALNFLTFLPLAEGGEPPFAGHLSHRGSWKTGNEGPLPLLRGDRSRRAHRVFWNVSSVLSQEGLLNSFYRVRKVMGNAVCSGLYVKKGTQYGVSFEKPISFRTLPNPF